VGYYVDVRVNGTRIRKQFPSREAAQAALVALRAADDVRALFWQPRNGAERRLGRPAAEIPGGIIRSPLVYAFLTAGGDVRYIGMSRVGVERPLHRLHDAHVDLQSSDRLQVWTFATAEDAAAAELALITALAPKNNRRVEPATLVELPAARNRRQRHKEGTSAIRRRSDAA